MDLDDVEDRRCLKCGGEHPRVTVCAVCNRASCWLGLFMCDGAKTAGTREVTVAELRALAAAGEVHESPHYWAAERAHG